MRSAACLPSIITDLAAGSTVSGKGDGVRWLIEPFFRVVKRLLGCRQLLSTKPGGLEIRLLCRTVLTRPLFRGVLFSAGVPFSGGDAEGGDDQAAFFALDDRDVGQVAQRLEP